MRVAVIGQGYVGLTAAVGLVAAGHDVVGIERDDARLLQLRHGHVPIFEPGLDQALVNSLSGGRLRFAAALDEAGGALDAIVIAVGSPPLASGGADTSQIEAALAEAVMSNANPPLIMLKSSVPPGTSRSWLETNKFPKFRTRYVYSPEFLNQGTALRDWCSPCRIVLGAWEQEAVIAAKRLLHGTKGKYVVTDPTEAEAIKYTSNAFLATRVSFANEIAGFCEAVGADVRRVLAAVGLDPRIGGLFWRPGIGYGDSCLPKDVDALIQQAATYGQPMRVLESVQATNRAQHVRPLAIVREERAPFAVRPLDVAVLGLAYEPHSDDVRSAPSLALVPELRLIARTIVAWDPLLADSVVDELFPFVRRASSPADAVCKADVVLVLTSYPEVVESAWVAALKTNEEPVIVVDAANCVKESAVAGKGAVYRAIGIPRRTTSPRRETHIAGQCDGW
jgi:UDPglucose 6-dehydrogenase